MTERSLTSKKHPIGVPRPLRYRAVADLLQRAITGDEGAAHTILHYLGSANPDLRRMIQATLHDIDDLQVWRKMLQCLANECWQAYLATPVNADVQLSLKDMHFDRQLPELPELPRIPLEDAHTQSIAEAFVLDESEAERNMKEGLLQEAVQDPEPNMIYAGAYLKGLRGDLDMIPLLDEMIEKGERPWKLRAIQALVVLNDEGCGPPLIRALAMDHDVLHQAARRALSDLGRKAEPALLEALQHPDSHIRWHAARGLGQIGDARAVDMLASGLSDENTAVRWTTARVLANLDAAAVPAILKVLTQQPINEPLRQAAFHALHAMPSLRTQEYLQPILDALRSPAASIQAPAIAQRMLSDWNPGHYGGQDDTNS